MSYTRYTPDRIVTLKENEVFVFGSNRGGYHGAGAALTAMRKFGAIYGQASGLQGRSYGIPTKDRKLNVLTVDEIKPHVDRFIKFAILNPQYTFFVTEIGTGLSRYKHKDIAPLFANALTVENIHLPEKFVSLLIK